MTPLFYLWCHDKESTKIFIAEFFSGVPNHEVALLHDRLSNDHRDNSIPVDKVIAVEEIIKCFYYRFYTNTTDDTSIEDIRSIIEFGSQSATSKKNKET